MLSNSDNRMFTNKNIHNFTRGVTASCGRHQTPDPLWHSQILFNRKIQIPIRSVCQLLRLNSFGFMFLRFSDLIESMRQAELCDWALDPTLFTSLCDSLNRFFSHKGLIGSSNGGPASMSQLASNPNNMQQATAASLACLTQPSPLSFPSQMPPCGGGLTIHSHRKTLQNQQRSPETHPAVPQTQPPNGKPS